MSTRNKVFISHANPEDNYVAFWLASKLQLLGYAVWLDTTDIEPGEAFWQNSQRVIKEQSGCFLSVVTQAYVEKANRHDSGVMNEVVSARGVRDIENFMVPLQVDDTPVYDYPMGLIGKKTIAFKDNWADGLEEVVKMLEERKIPKNEEATNVTKFWYESKKIRNTANNQPEDYYSNWFPVALPEHIFLYHIDDVEGAKKLFNCSITYLNNSNILTFAPPAVVTAVTGAFTCLGAFNAVEAVATDQLKLASGAVVEDIARQVAKLLNRTLAYELRRVGLQAYELSSRRFAYYWPLSVGKKNVPLRELGFGQNSRRTLAGKHQDHMWHFAISFSFRTRPTFHYLLTSHIIFTDASGKLVDSDTQHELRRALGSTWYNRKWLETLLAMLFQIAGQSPKGFVFSGRSESEQVLSVLPYKFTSEVGYNEPAVEDED
jgi:hypothetical protein